MYHKIEASKTHCSQGHEYNEVNTYVNPRSGHRLCRVCHKAYQANRRLSAGVKPGKNQDKTHCPQSHEYTSENTYIDPQGTRTCRTCMVDWDLKRKYGINLTQYEAIARAQDYQCAACGKQERKRLAVDHCHETGKVRGLLCSNCNVAIGMAGDTLEGVMRLAAYLLLNEEH